MLPETVAQSSSGVVVCISGFVVDVIFAHNGQAYM